MPADNPVRQQLRAYLHDLMAHLSRQPEELRDIETEALEDSRYEAFFSVGPKGLYRVIPSGANGTHGSDPLAGLVAAPTESPTTRPTPPTESAVDGDDLALLRVLRTASGLTAREIAARMNVPNNATLRSQLSRLKRAGLVANPGRGYSLTALGLEALTLSDN